MSVRIKTWQDEFLYPEGSSWRITGDDWPTLEVLNEAGDVIAAHRNWDYVGSSEPVQTGRVMDSQTCLDAFVAAHMAKETPDGSP